MKILSFRFSPAATMRPPSTAANSMGLSRARPHLGDKHCSPSHALGLLLDDWPRGPCRERQAARSYGLDLVETILGPPIGVRLAPTWGVTADSSKPMRWTKRGNAVRRLLFVNDLATLAQKSGLPICARPPRRIARAVTA